MVINDKEYGQFDVDLSDDGTLDTVISVCPIDSIIMQNETRDIRYSQEYGANYRDENGAMTDDGFIELAKNAVECYIEQYLI